MNHPPACCECGPIVASPAGLVLYQTTFRRGGSQTALGAIYCAPTPPLLDIQPQPRAGSTSAAVDQDDMSLPICPLLPDEYYPGQRACDVLVALQGQLNITGHHHHQTAPGTTQTPAALPGHAAARPTRPDRLQPAFPVHGIGGHSG